MAEHYDVLIVGGGAAGISVAARLCALPKPPKVGIIEPSTKHYYQPLWTLVGGGVFPKEDSEREEADFIPDTATWIRDAVATFQPDANTVITRSGQTYGYDVLVVAPGIQLDWSKVEGLQETLGKDRRVQQLLLRHRGQHLALPAGLPQRPKIIGIDEISTRKRHTYRIVVSDLIRGGPGLAAPIAPRPA